ncbi:hypothetical protein Apmu_0056_19 [Acidiphilium multivorum AIU301]|nr:hypothetical protein APM_0634 [Acidiphilium sp. PM]GAN73127.1 hypothetical protein Apmu_0056_19 [Acidiphilium multivorum AIU301]
MTTGGERETDMQVQMTDEERSKDEFFQRVAQLSEEMVARHGREFTMGTLVLAARWIAENRIGSETAPS